MDSAVNKNAIITFIPALHAGYLSFFRKYPGILYVLGPDFIADFPHMERDLRTPDIEDLKKMLNSLDLFEQVIILDRETIKNIPNDLSIVMPTDEISEKVAELYLQGKIIHFESIFLRWNRMISTKEFEVSPDRIISEEERDKELMKKAFVTAEKSSDWWRRIGTLIVKGPEIAVTGFNSHLPTDFNMDAYGDPRSNFDAGISFELSTAIHGESRAIALAAKNGITTNGASIYVTTFPCPVCAKLIAEAGIRKVYYSAGYSLVDAESILKAFNVEIIMVK